MPSRAEKQAEAFAEFHANLPEIVAYLKKAGVIKKNAYTLSFFCKQILICSARQLILGKNNETNIPVYSCSGGDGDIEASGHG